MWQRIADGKLVVPLEEAVMISLCEEIDGFEDKRLGIVEKPTIIGSVVKVLYG